MADVSNRNRQPEGQSIGGQFATERKGESGVELGAEGVFDDGAERFRGQPDYLAELADQGWTVFVGEHPNDFQVFPDPESERGEPGEYRDPYPGLKGSTVIRSSPCSRCGGTGRLPEHSNVLNGVCFKCGGVVSDHRDTRLVSTARASARKRAKSEAEAAQNIADFKARQAAELIEKAARKDGLLAEMDENVRVVAANGLAARQEERERWAARQEAVLEALTRKYPEGDARDLDERSFEVVFVEQEEDRQYRRVLGAGFRQDMFERLEEGREFSPRQWDAFVGVLGEDVRSAAAPPVVEGRYRVKAKVERTYLKESDFGEVTKMVLRDEEGRTFDVSVPGVLDDQLWGFREVRAEYLRRFHQAGLSDEECDAIVDGVVPEVDHYEGLKGAVVEVTARFSPSDREPSRGWGSRPGKDAVSDIPAKLEAAREALEARLAEVSSPSR